ncbi:hypothetical protein V8C37DRAFT_402737 [Trichoderma ceciliae]
MAMTTLCWHEKTGGKATQTSLIPTRRPSGIEKKLIKDASLWDRAYNALHEEKFYLFAKQEDLLSAVLARAYLEDGKVSTTLLGHKLFHGVVVNIAGAVDYIKDAVRELPYASIIVASVSHIIPLLKNSTAAEPADQDGFIYITSQMSYTIPRWGRSKLT